MFKRTSFDAKSRQSAGFGLIEVLLSMAVVAALTTGVLHLAGNQRANMSSFSKRFTCNEVAESVMNTIKAYDNALIVRNWIPPSHDYAGGGAAPLAIPVAHDLDPYCTDANGHTSVCDSQNISASDGSGYVTSYKVHQNVRGAATWAQSIYNANRLNGICVGDGILFPSTSVKAVLPGNIELPTNIDGVSLFVKDTAKNCTVLSNSTPLTHGKFQIKVKVGCKNDSGGPAISFRENSSVVTFFNDTDKPTTTVVVKNGFEDVVAFGKCSDTRTMQQIVDGGGVVGNTWRNLHFDISSTEPGALPLCRKDAFEIDAATKFTACQDMTFAGNLATVPAAAQIPTYNSKMQVRISNLQLPVNDLVHYKFQVKTVDVGENFSDPVSLDFLVRTPVCPLTTTYCPNATNPGPFGPVGIFFWPKDDCNNGPCLAGTRTLQGCPDPATICVNATAPDDCGNSVCPGTNPGSACPDPASFCGPGGANSCGIACADGTSCGGGGGGGGGGGLPCVDGVGAAIGTLIIDCDGTTCTSVGSMGPGVGECCSTNCIGVCDGVTQGPEKHYCTATHQ